MKLNHHDLRLLFRLYVRSRPLIHLLLAVCLQFACCQNRTPLATQTVAQPRQTGYGSLVSIYYVYSTILSDIAAESKLLSLLTLRLSLQYDHAPLSSHQACLLVRPPNPPSPSALTARARSRSCDCGDLADSSRTTSGLFKDVQHPAAACAASGWATTVRWDGADYRAGL